MTYEMLRKLEPECVCCPMGIECSVPGTVIKAKDVKRTNCEGEALEPHYGQGQHP
jgi:hypothetical protein